MKSGMMAAESVFEAVQEGRSGDELGAYAERFRDSWVYEELRRARNFRPAFRLGLLLGTLYGGFDLKLLRGRVPWTFRHSPDHTRLKKAADCPKIEYPKPDGKVTFDRLSSVFLSNTNHEEDQPVHLTLGDDSVPIKVNLADYDAPEQRYCPAGVYEIVGQEEGEPGCRSTPRTACTVRRAISRIPPKISIGSCPKAAAGRITRICRGFGGRQQASNKVVATRVECSLDRGTAELISL